MKEYCQKTPLGEEVRYSHRECGDTRGRLYVKRIRKGWLMHCFNCEESKFVANDGMSPSDVLSEVNPSANQSKDSWWIPQDLTDDLPAKALDWLYKYGISNGEIDEHKFQYSPCLNRLFLPVFDGEDMVYWQGRNLGRATKTNPKYLNVTSPGKEVVFKCNTYDNGVVIVEDILSAIKVGRVMGGIALLGSVMKESIIPLLMRKVKVYLWLDQDKYDQAYYYYKRLSTVYGLPMTLVSTTLDPKEFSTEEIYKLLCPQQ